MPHDIKREAPPDGGLRADGLAPVEPSFAEPWQARAFALAVLASRQGCFTWSEWTHALGRELQRAPDAGYFDCWLATLQSLLLGKGAIGQGELRDRKHAWEDAFRRTPHGAPVTLTGR
ncbi:MAG TPA: nitrile hydratase accessory protein [Steroidobacteraceae bacterium]|nr:nitrile hydratase accessory protein [Steroidobacteraceae bacterium]